MCEFHLSHHTSQFRYRKGGVSRGASYVFPTCVAAGLGSHCGVITTQVASVVTRSYLWTAFARERPQNALYDTSERAVRNCSPVGSPTDTFRDRRGASSALSFKASGPNTVRLVSSASHFLREKCLISLHPVIKFTFHSFETSKYTPGLDWDDDEERGGTTAEVICAELIDELRKMKFHA